MDSWIWIVIIVIFVLLLVWAVSSYSKKHYKRPSPSHVHGAVMIAGRNSDATTTALDADIDDFYTNNSGDMEIGLNLNHDADINQMRFELEQEFQEILPN